MDYAKELLTSSAGSIHSANSSATSRPRAKSVASTKLREQGLTEIVPIQQTNSSQAKIEGSLVVTEPGNYVLVFGKRWLSYYGVSPSTDGLLLSNT